MGRFTDATNPWIEFGYWICGNERKEEEMWLNSERRVLNVVVFKVERGHSLSV